MSADSVDLRQLTPENLDTAIRMWTDLDRLVDKTHPKFPQYMKLSAKAKSSYERLKISINTSGGLGDIDGTILGLNDLYEEALRIRGEMCGDGMKKDFAIPAGESFQSAIDKRVEEAFTGVNETDRTAIESELLPMLYGLGVNPADVREGDLIDNYYFLPNSGFVNFTNISKAWKKVQSLRDAGAVSPGLLAIADILEKGLTRIESIDPAGTAIAAYNESRQPHSVGDGKLPRLLGAVGAGIITAFGLAQFAYSAANDKSGKGTHFSPLIVGWAAIAMACINPKLFTESSSDKTLAKIASLGQPEPRKVIGGGFNDPEALAELQELRSTNVKDITELAKLDTLTVAQVEGLTGSTNSSLTKTLVGMLPSLRPAALREFGIRQMDDGEIEIAQTFMKTIGVV